MSLLQSSLLIGAAITTALIAGLFYAYACSVNPGLGRLPDAAYLTAMQSINRAILNPVFFASFMGAAVLLPLSTWAHYVPAVPGRFWWLLAATTTYLIGGFGVTVLGNVPLNEALNSFSIQTASPADLAAQRAAFEVRWNQLHTLRTLASGVALVLVVLACVAPSRP